jgi:hypothetical protein
LNVEPWNALQSTSPRCFTLTVFAAAIPAWWEISTMTEPCFIHLRITLPPSNLICHWMASKRPSTAVWCGGTEIPAALNLSIKVPLTPRKPHAEYGHWLNGVVQRFYDPIVLPDGRKLLTLRDAAEYITALPRAEHDAADWQVAMETLLLVAERDGPEMLARIAVMKALNGNKPR